MNHAVVAAELYRDAGRLELAGIGFTLVPKNIEFGRDHQRGRKAAQIGRLRWRNVRMPPILCLLDIMIPVPGHLGTGQEEALGVSRVGLVIEVGISDGIEQNLELHAGRPTVASHQAGHGGKVASRAVTGDRNALGITAQLGRMIRDPQVAA